MLNIINPIASHFPLPHLISVRGLYKSYELAGSSISVLSDINLTITQGECIAVMGKSGSGKTTLLNLITGIDRPTSGEIFVGNQSINALTENALAQWRGKNIGIVFQFFQLLPTLTLLENVILPMDFCHQFPGSQRRARALILLDRVGIADHAHKLPSALSGGQQQRAAIARALANDPPLILADEPTGNLDSTTSDQIMQLFTELAREGKTIIAVTHERDISRYCNRVITLVDGKIFSLQGLSA